MIAIGVNQGMQPIIGYNYGSNNYVCVKEAFNYAFKIASVISCVSFRLGCFMPYELIRTFSFDVGLLAISAILLGLRRFHLSL